MSKLATLIILLALSESIVSGCLITNCPRGGKRSKLALSENTIKSCLNCGPGQTGQCFGPNICCGPFGCLLGTPETLRCQRDGFFHEREPCIAGTSPCRKNTGRCAFDGICCSQDSCHSDKACASEEKSRSFSEVPLDLYNLINYQAELVNDK
uniref:Inotocin n=2 Tax=Zophobas TaxID=7073 RepID=A0A977XCI2_ZOPAT|nr:inotocin [Zophobas atratus]